jgi:hypothetical protein
MNRREMLKATTMLASTITIANWAIRKQYRYALAKISGGDALFPNGKYIPFDWSFSEISNQNEGIKLSWDNIAIKSKDSARLRITSATDVREALVLEVRTAISNKKIADWDLQFAAYMQPFDLEISKENVEEVLYSAMEDYKLDIIIGEGPAARAQPRVQHQKGEDLHGRFGCVRSSH